MRRTDKNKPLQVLKVNKESGLLDYLIENNVRKSRNAIKSLLTHKQIRVNDKTQTQFDLALKPGDEVGIYPADLRKNKKELKGLQIIFEDDYLIVVEKESKVLSISTGQQQQQITVYKMLSDYVLKKKRNARVHVLHRLDRDVSGLMILAKDEETQEMLQQFWDSYVVERTYVAVVEGEIEPKEATFDSWLTEDKNFKMHSSFKENGGQKAITHYKVLKYNDQFSLLRLTPETSRKNQVRVQLEHAGFPIVGDKKYGSTMNPIKRIALHADRIKLIHPYTKERLTFDSPIPKKMQQLMNTP